MSSLQCCTGRCDHIRLSIDVRITCLVLLSRVSLPPTALFPLPPTLPPSLSLFPRFFLSLFPHTSSFPLSLSYDEFMDSSTKLNYLENYPQLQDRSARIGYEVTKVVFRGYHASDKLQVRRRGEGGGGKGGEWGGGGGEEGRGRGGGRGGGGKGGEGEEGGGGGKGGEGGERREGGVRRKREENEREGEREEGRERGGAGEV